MSEYELCKLFGITQDEIELRSAFLRICPEDKRNIEVLHEIFVEDVENIVSEFYDHLGTFSGLSRFFADERTIARLRKAQEDYLLSLGKNSEELAYFESRLRIGLTHEKKGLEQKWYLGGYVTLCRIIGRRVQKRCAGDAEKTASIITTLHKYFTMDSILAVETYHQAATNRLEAILSELTEAQQRLQEISRTDGLTGISNRKYATESLEMEIYRSRRFSHDFTLLLIDIDHFKEVNDSFGHVFGDYALKRSVQLIQEVLRPADIIGRYGGEEFVVGLVECDCGNAEQIAERLRLKIALAGFAFDGQETKLTISTGIACMGGESETLDKMIARADSALYEAKASGRNKVCVARS